MAGMLLHEAYDPVVLTAVVTDSSIQRREVLSGFVRYNISRTCKVAGYLVTPMETLVPACVLRQSLRQFDLDDYTGKCYDVRLVS